LMCLECCLPAFATSRKLVPWLKATITHCASWMVAMIRMPLPRHCSQLPLGMCQVRRRNISTFSSSRNGSTCRWSYIIDGPNLVPAWVCMHTTSRILIIWYSWVAVVLHNDVAQWCGATLHVTWKTITATYCNTLQHWLWV
jgi:hypothetical protein